MALEIIKGDERRYEVGKDMNEQIVKGMTDVKILKAKMILGDVTWACKGEENDKDIIIQSRESRTINY